MDKMYEKLCVDNKKETINFKLNFRVLITQVQWRKLNTYFAA